MKTVTIVLPISSPQHLEALLASLEQRSCARERTRLLVYVDGDRELFLTARNFTEHSKFAQRLCVQGDLLRERREFSVNTRRRRIAAIHNAVRKLLEPCDYVLLIEDDGILPAHALTRLQIDYLAHPKAGFIEGVEL